MKEVSERGLLEKPIHPLDKTRSTTVDRLSLDRKKHSVKSNEEAKKIKKKKCCS